MEFNLSQLEGMFYDIQAIIGYFEQSEYDSRRNTIFLSSGEKLNYSVPKNRIAHLLGINTDYLRSTGIFREDNAYDLLKELSNNAYKIHQLSRNGVISYSNLFSPYIKNKLEAFIENIKINIFQTELVCKYESRKTYTISEKRQKYDYIIVKKYPDTGKYGILGLVKAPGEFNYVPMSSQLYNTEEELDKALEELIQNQDITIMNGMTVSNINVDNDYNKSYTLPLDIKYTKLKKLKEYKINYNCGIDVTQDYEYSLSETLKHMDNHFDDNTIIDEIARCIKQGKLIDVNTYRNTKLFNVIDAFNDYICTNGVGTSEEVGTRYSTIKKELEEVKKQLLLSNNTIFELTEENTELKTSVSKLTSQNESYQETQQKILELINPTIKPSK